MRDMFAQIVDERWKEQRTNVEMFLARKSHVDRSAHCAESRDKYAFPPHG